MTRAPGDLVARTEEAADDAGDRALAGLPARLGFDRYATSKLLDTVTAIELARRIAPERTAFYTLEPGMMPGTGLSRDMPLVVRVMWATVMRWMVPFLANASTPERSAASLVWLLTAEPAPAASGDVLDFNRRPSRLLWPRARAPGARPRRSRPEPGPARRDAPVTVRTCPSEHVQTVMDRLTPRPIFGQRRIRTRTVGVTVPTPGGLRGDLQGRIWAPPAADATRQEPVIATRPWIDRITPR